MVRGVNVKRGTTEWGEDARFWSDLKPDLALYELRVGDVVIGMDGSRLGENFAVIRDSDLPALLVQRVTRLRARDGMDQGFLRYLVCNPSFTSYIKAVHTGTAIPHVSGGQIARFPVRIPILAEQRAIARVLGSLDDKIELNRRMNQTLEDICRALFKFWFVDFGPVRAKQEGRWKKGESLPGMPADMWDLWPSEFEESEIGEIPTGWQILQASEVVEVSGGSTPSTSEAAYWKEGTHAWATPKDLAPLRTPVLLRTERKITEAGLSTISSGLLPTGTVLLSSRAPIGYLAISEIPVAVNQGFIAIQCNKGVSSQYMLRWAESNLEEIKSVANGTTFLEVNKQNFRLLPILVPDKAILGVFDAFASRLYRTEVNNERECGTLSSLRDALLPKLLSGEIRVKADE